MTGTGESMGDKLRKGVGLVHGTGETLRGNFNATVDSAAGDRASAARHETVAERGLDEMQHGHYHGTGAGVTPVDTERERQNRALQGETLHTGSTNHGPHATNVGNKADPRVDSDLNHRGVGTGLGTSTTGTTGTTGLGSSNYGPHSSNIGNKADPRVDSDLDHRRTVGGSTTTSTTHTTTGPHSTSGPHSTDFANKADPRVDSDLSHQSTGITSHQGTGIPHDGTATGPHTSNLSNKLGGTHGSTTTGTVPPTSNFASSLEHGNTSGTAHHGTVHDSTNHGPHSSNLANKLDPRVDSDRDNRAVGLGTGTGTGLSHQGQVDSLVEAGERRHHGTGVGAGTGTGVTHGTGTGLGHGQGRVDSLVDGRTAGHGTTHGSTNYGPHDSNIANKADPRVDSDLDGRGVGHNTTGVGHTGKPRVDEVTGYSTTGTGKHSTNHGPHDSNVANKADPRFDSDLDHRGTTHTGTTHTGTTHTGATHNSTNVAHNSKIANVLDPRVDSKTGTWK